MSTSRPRLTRAHLLLASLSLGVTVAVTPVAAALASSRAPAAPVPWTWERMLLFPVARSGVSGSAYFTDTTRSGVTTVTLTVRGLRPLSVHPAHIHQGRCGSNGPVLYPFPPVVANRVGVGVSTTRVPGRFAHQPWSINVHAGPGMSTLAQARVLSCGNVL